jgi:outer membrane usher protein
MSFSLSANRTENDDVFYDVFVGLNIILGKNRSGTINYNMQEDMSTLSASIHKSPPIGIGYGYRARVETTEYEKADRETSGNASVQYKGAYGIYSGEYRRTEDQDSYDLNLSGSLAYIDKAFYPSRPIYDSFALVKVADVEGVRVKYQNQEVGSTNNQGEVIVPGLISYYNNKISIESVDLPLEYNIYEEAKYVSTPYRSGGIVEFDVSKLQTFEGTLFFIDNGKKHTADYAGLQLKVDDKIIETIVGTNGAYYLENIPPGTFPAKLFLDDKECHFNMVIPESDETIVEMGEITCELN